jgi:hypothetical protein
MLIENRALGVAVTRQTIIFICGIIFFRMTAASAPLMTGMDKVILLHI